MEGLDDGRSAVRLARATVARALGRPVVEPPRLPDRFHERRGVFVSWYVHPNHRLRGCVGFPLPVLPLEQGVREAALAAAEDDPRFPPIVAAELDHLVAEVSILGPLIAVPPEERPGAIVVGRDGVVAERGRLRGLLLPQVAPEQGWDREQLLEGVCDKAGLPNGAWRHPDVRLFRFEAQVYRERAPGGDVVRGRVDG